MTTINASDMLRVGVIGLGGAAMQMLPSLMAHPGVRIVACADPNLEARTRFAEDFEATAYDGPHALCEDSGVDAVYIATPHSMHRDHAVAAAEAGKHIIVEKPMALTLEDCDAMIAAAERNRVQLVVGHTHSFDPPIRAMREIIASGALGRLAMISTAAYGNFLYRPRRPEELRTDLGGGIIYNQVPHQMDVVRLLGGGLLRSVRAMTWQLDPERPTEGSHMSFLQFEDGCTASVIYSGYDYFDTDEFHGWVGELGEERRPGGQGAARAALRALHDPVAEPELKGTRGYSQKPAIVSPKHPPHSGITIASCAGGDLRAGVDGVMLYGRNGLVDHPVGRGRAFPDKEAVIDELLDAVLRGRAPLHDGRWGKATMEASLAVLASAESGQEIVLQHQVPVKDA